MAKYDVELITDKHGKPMPQYFDEKDGIMKPITKDNFDGTINGSVDVEFPDVQKVEVTNQVEIPTEMNVNVNNPIDTVSVDNLPVVQRVEVTNAQTQMDVNVLNPVDSVSVDNLPNDYPDQAVEARLQAIEQTQSQILNKLNDTIDTRLTGSIDELDVIVKGTSLTKKFVNLDKRNLNIESGQSVVISYCADNGEIWRPLHAYIEIAPPVDSTDKHGRILILNPFNSYRSINLGPSASSSENSYVSIKTKGDEEVANWFQTLVMTDSSGFSTRITNNSDGIVNTVLGGMVVEVINDENR